MFLVVRPGAPSVLAPSSALNELQAAFLGFDSHRRSPSLSFEHCGVVDHDKDFILGVGYKPSWLMASHDSFVRKAPCFIQHWTYISLAQNRSVGKKLQLSMSPHTKRQLCRIQEQGPEVTTVKQAYLASPKESPPK